MRVGAKLILYLDVTVYQRYFIIAVKRFCQSNAKPSTLEVK